jgi:uncharacterized protein (DUF1697 family)
MASAVFLRGVNVGGKTFQPSAIAKAIGAVNLGAAGTFVVPGDAKAAEIQAKVLAALPFEADVMVCPAKEVLALAEGEGFGRGAPKEAQRFVSVLAAKPRKLPAFPIDRPTPDAWQLRIVGVEGRYALSLRRAAEPGKFYPNEVVERTLGVRATTRNWSTVEALAKVLSAQR